MMSRKRGGGGGKGERMMRGRGCKQRSKRRGE
jgi:hypothetical protein